MHWLRLYTEVLDDPKIQRLPPDLFRAWVNCLCLARAHEGVLPPVQDVAFRLRLSLEEAQAILAELQTARLLDDHGGRLIPHNWAQRQFSSDSSAERMKRLRQRRRDATAKRHSDGDVTANVTPPEQSRADTEQNRTEQSRAREAARAAYSPALLAHLQNVVEGIIGQRPDEQEAEGLLKIGASVHPHPQVLAAFLARVGAERRRNGSPIRRLKLLGMVVKDNYAGWLRQNAALVATIERGEIALPAASTAAVAP